MEWLYDKVMKVRMKTKITSWKPHFRDFDDITFSADVPLHNRESDLSETQPMIRYLSLGVRLASKQVSLVAG